MLLKRGTRLKSRCPCGSWRKDKYERQKHKMCRAVWKDTYDMARRANERGE